MLKATKLTFAAILLASSCGLAVAQGGAAEPGGVTTDTPVNRDTMSSSKESQHGVTTTAPSDVTMQERNASMPTQAGPNEAGTAKDTAGSATQRDPAKQKQ